MWPLNYLTNRPPVHDPCATNICEDIKRNQANRALCKACAGSNVQGHKQIGNRANRKGFAGCKSCAGSNVRSKPVVQGHKQMGNRGKFPFPGNIEETRAGCKVCRPGNLRTDHSTPGSSVGCKGCRPGNLRTDHSTPGSSVGCKVCRPGSSGSNYSATEALVACKVCCPGSSDCNGELLSTWTHCEERIVPCLIKESSSGNVPQNFLPPPGVEDQLSVIGLLWAVRNELANFQASRGVTMEQYGFFDLLLDIIYKITSSIVAVCHLSQMCLKHIFHVFLEFICISLYVVRFIIDSILSIHMAADTADTLNTTDTSNISRIKKLTPLIIFAIEVLGILIVLEYTIGKIVVPMWMILSKMIRIML